MTETSRNTRHVGTNVLLVQGGKILLARRQNTGWADDQLGIPGGHLEQGETGRQAAAREIKEELGLEITQDRLIFLATALVNSNYEYIYQEFYVELQPGETPINAEPEKCSELVWCDPQNLPSDIPESFKIIVERGYIAHETYFEIGY